nr:mitogen-activated protein kinase kinase kinase NPK1-like [Ipomoea batatas]
MGTWEKHNFLGSGSYGQVHLAVLKPARKMEMAVKSAAIQDSSSLEREGVFLDALRDCPFIVQCFGEDVSVEHGQHMYNLLLEYASGGTLYQLIRTTGEIPEFHGLKRLKLCDVGLAKFSDEKNVYGDSHSGTLLYAPPECVAGKSYTAAKDIWALGCIFVEMVTGQPMWQFGNKQELAMKIASTNPEIPEDLSSRAKSFLKMCLARDPWRRWTAEMLLGHRFFEKLGVPESKEDEGFVNPLGPWRWSSGRDLFTVPSFTYIVENVVSPEEENEKEKEVDGSGSVMFSRSSSLVGLGVAFEKAWLTWKKEGEENKLLD